jgi:hypothetical protein
MIPSASGPSSYRSSSWSGPMYWCKTNMLDQNPVTRSGRWSHQEHAFSLDSATKFFTPIRQTICIWTMIWSKTPSSASWPTSDCSSSRSSGS